MTTDKVIAAVILVYDYMLTLEQEVKLLWPTKLTTAKVLFLVARYTPFLDLVGVVITYHLLDSPRACTVLYTYALWSYTVGICITEVILALRCWAVWGRDRRFGIGLGISLAMIWVAVLGLVIKFQNTLIFSPATEQGCFLTGGSRTAYVVLYALFLASDSLVLVLTLAKCLKSMRSTSHHSIVLASLYKDGILYYLLVTGIVR